MIDIIAEIAQAHDGSLGILHSYIDALAETGVNTIKFQTHIADAESSEHETFRINFSYVDLTRKAYWQRMGFTEEQWAGIKLHCDKLGIEFLSTAFSIEAFELLERLNVRRHKVASGEVMNDLLLEKIARTKKPVLLSSGMSSYSEIERAYTILSSHGSKVSVMQCTTAYPTPPEKYGLNVITELQNRFGMEVGLSDHSGEIAPSIAAAALGAKYLEFHAVFSKKMFGPDATSSLTIDQIADLTRSVRLIETALLHPVDKNKNKDYDSLKQLFGKSLSIRRNMAKGDIVHEDDLETRKPGGKGINASEYRLVIGKMVNKALEKGAFINFEDLT